MGLCSGATGREKGSLITHMLSTEQLPELCPRDLEPEAAGLPHSLAFMPSISEFIWRKGKAYEAVPRWPPWGHFWHIQHWGALVIFFRVGVCGLWIPQRWSLRGLGKRQRSKAGVITSHQTRGPAMHPCPGTMHPRVSRGQRDTFILPPAILASKY